MSGTCNRRRVLTAAAGGLAVVGATRLLASRDENGQRAEVCVMKADAYDDASGLVDSIGRGLRTLGLLRSEIRGKSVLLKPNLVEPDRRAPQVSTHPALILAALECFRRLDAREVTIAEGPGHVRDSDYVLEQSGLGPALREARASFVDLNRDRVYEVPNRLGMACWRSLWLPEALKRADVIVSMPKMKTHHWVGVTLSMKNLFGVMPGIAYGWPKNILHHQGIGPSILDINAAVPCDFAIVDGVVGMQGDGPIMGDACPSGVIVMGRNLPAVDATSARLMCFSPERVSYLAAASGQLGPIGAAHIAQRGECIADLARAYALTPNPELGNLRA